MSLRSALGRVKGLGPAGEGVEHWWTHRMSSLALVPLTVWLVASIVAMAGADFIEIRAWMSSPVVAGLLILCVIVGFHHASMSLQVVLEEVLLEKEHPHHHRKQKKLLPSIKSVKL